MTDVLSPGHGLEWNRKWNEIQRKFQYKISMMPEWNGRFQEWNRRQSSILPCKFHTRFCSWHLQKNIRIVINKNMRNREAFSS